MVFELKTGTQNMQYLLDKAASDAMADTIDTETCTVDGTEYAGTINKYFKNITGNATEYHGMQCMEIIVPEASSGTDFSFDLNCYKIMPSGFRAEYIKEITLNKEVTVKKESPGIGQPEVCTAQVKDLQSETCDALINKATCE